MKKKTHEEYICEVNLINNNIQVKEKYNGSFNKIKHRCKICGYEWFVAPANIIQGRGCPQCVGKVHKTHEQYVSELTKKNSNIEVVDTYINNRTKIKHRCVICQYEWIARPDVILSGGGCPQCANIKKQLNLTKTNDKYVSELKQINPNIELIDTYNGSNIKIKHHCLICGHMWFVTPNSILHGTGCPECDKNKKSLRHEEYVYKVSLINQNIEVVEQYNRSFIPILHKCKLDGFEWVAYPNNILNGQGCPKCNESKGEKAITNWLNKNNILYESQKRFADCKNIKPLPFDFYLPNYNIVIEYQGIQHYESIEYFGGQENFENQILRDNIKRKYCEDNNIILFEIPYYSDLDRELIKLYDIIKSKNIL